MSISGVFIASALKAGTVELSVSMSHTSVRESWPFRSASSSIAWDGRSGEFGCALIRTSGVGSSSASGVRGWNGGTGVSKHGTDVESGSRSSVSKSRIDVSPRVASPTSTRRFLGRATGVKGWWVFWRVKKAERGVEFSLSESKSLAGVAGAASGSKRARTLCRGRFMVVELAKFRGVICRCCRVASCSPSALRSSSGKRPSALPTAEIRL